MVHVDPTAMEAAEADLTSEDIDVVRLGYSDLIGAERGRDILTRRFARTVGDGVAFCRSVYGTSPMGDVVDIEGGMSAGLPDVVAVPDLSTVQHVPWEPGVAHMIADVFNPDGSPVPGEPPQRAAPSARPLRRAGHEARSSAPSSSSTSSSRARRRRPAGSGTARAPATSTPPGSRATPRTR